MEMISRSPNNHAAGLIASGQVDAAEEHTLSVARAAIDTARGKMTHTVNSAMVEAYWTIGREIAETVGDRAEYGSHLITYLARNLITEYGKGFSEPNLRNMRQFYRAFPIRYTLSSELSWSHYQRIMRVDSPAAREFYVREAATANWGVRELKRQIDTHLYERLLRTQEAEVLDGVADTERALTVLHDPEISSTPSVRVISSSSCMLRRKWSKLAMPGSVTTVAKLPSIQARFTSSRTKRHGRSA